MLSDYLFKIIVVGNSGVGKSSLLFRFIDGEFYENQLPTIGVDFKRKTIEHEDKSIKLQIWDTAGQERFGTVCVMYYKCANGALIVYDVTDRQSFQDVEKWVQQVEERGAKDAKMMLIGNKNDREDIRAVSYEEGKALADKLGFDFFETSAKENIQVKEAFTQLAIALQKEKDASGEAFPQENQRPLYSYQEEGKLCVGCCTY